MSRRSGARNASTMLEKETWALAHPAYFIGPFEPGKVPLEVAARQAGLFQHHTTDIAIRRAMNLAWDRARRKQIAQDQWNA